MIKWPKRIIVVRHGESEQNAATDLLEKNLDEKLLQAQKGIRDADIKLTEKGIWQAKETGKLLRKFELIDFCFCSPYIRTLQTAENIVSELNKKVEILKDNRLREKEFGRLHGFTKNEIKEKYPEEFFDREREGKYWYRLPRGENYPDVEARIHSFLDKLHRDCNGKTVLVVTHHVPCLMFRALFEHLGEKEVLELGNISNCGIEIFEIDTTKKFEGKMVLKEFNLIAY